MKATHPSCHPPIVPFALALALCLPATSSAASKALGLAGPLDDYERTAERVARSGTPEERGAAVAALAHLASSRYESLRDALASDPSPLVQLGLLSAMAEMGDTSEPAQSILWTCLASDDARVVEEAKRVEFQKLELPIPFERIWNPSRPTQLWLRDWSMADKLVGVGKTRPWKDPAWAKTPSGTQFALLCRAGTREAVPLAIAGIMARKYSLWFSLWEMEPVDRPYLRELVRDPRPQLRLAASRVLIRARDEEHLAYLTRLIDDYCHRKTEIPDSDWDGLAIEQALPLLSDDMLRLLLVQISPQHFWSVEWQLSRRGIRLSYEQLMGRTQFPDKVYLARVENLWREQLYGLVQERVYGELSAQLAAALGGPNPKSDLEVLLAQVSWSRDFLDCMPPEVAESCVNDLNVWIGKALPKYLTGGVDRLGVTQALILTGVLATPSHEAALWKRWRNDSDPLRNAEVLLPVAGGTSQRCEDLRQMLRAVRGERWFHSALGDFFMGERPRPSQADPCRPAHERLPDFIDTLPDAPPALEKAKDRLLRSLTEAGLLHSRRAAAGAFLELRGAPLREGDVVGAYRVLGDRKAPVRREAYAFAGELVPANPGYTPEMSVAQSKLWVEGIPSAMEKLAATPARPGPPISASDRARLESLLKQEKQAYAAKLIQRIVTPPESGIIVDWAGPPPTPRYTTLPSPALLDAGIDDASETRALLGSDQAPVRQAAAWALLQMFRDPSALAVLLADARGGEPKAKAQALYVLQHIRCRDAAALFPPLLTDPDKTLRQVGLFGVQAFGLTGSLPEVENLVTDLDGAVAATAVETLGLLHPPEARSLLMALVARADSLSHDAAGALRSYWKTEDIDAFISRLADPAADSAERWTLLAIVIDVTGRGGPQALAFARSPNQQNVSAEMIREWQEWWAQNRRRPLADRTRDVIRSLVVAYLNDSDPEKLGRKAWAVARYFSVETSPNVIRREQSREGFARDWPRVQGASAWEMLTGLEWSKPLDNINLLMRLDRQRAQRFLFSLFSSTSRGVPTLVWVGRRDSVESYHDILVRYAGVDFGDPSRARCEAKEAVLADWDAWARAEGWAP